MTKTVSIKSRRTSAAQLEVARAHAARLVPVEYRVVAGTPDRPAGSTEIMLEDPSRVRK